MDRDLHLVVPPAYKVGVSNHPMLTTDTDPSARCHAKYASGHSLVCTHLLPACSSPKSNSTQDFVGDTQHGKGDGT